MKKRQNKGDYTIRLTGYIGPLTLALTQVTLTITLVCFSISPIGGIHILYSALREGVQVFVICGREGY